MSFETVQAKIAFERYSEERGVHICHYHANNGRFADKGFIYNCQLNNQRLTYSGVSTHFQNGIADKRIQDLQEGTRTSFSSLFTMAMHVEYPPMAICHVHSQQNHDFHTNQIL